MKKWFIYLLVLPFTLGSQPLDKALEAGYIQSGTSGFIDSTQGYLVQNYARPIYLDKLAAPYFIYKNKCLTIPVGQDRLKIQTDSVTLSIPF